VEVPRTKQNLCRESSNLTPSKLYDLWSAHLYRKNENYKKQKIKPIKIKKHQNPISNKKFTSYKKSSFETNMQSFQEIDNIYENFFSDA